VFRDFVMVSSSIDYSRFKRTSALILVEYLPAYCVHGPNMFKFIELFQQCFHAGCFT